MTHCLLSTDASCRVDDEKMLQEIDRQRSCQGKFLTKANDVKGGNQYLREVNRVFAGHFFNNGGVTFRATIIGEVIGRPTHRPYDHFQLVPRVVASEHGYATQQLSEYDSHRPLRALVSKVGAKHRQVRHHIDCSAVVSFTG